VGETKGKLYGIAARMHAMTPEEKKVFYAERSKKIAFSRHQKLEEISEWKAETLTKLAHDLKNLSLDFRDPNVPISEAALYLFKDMIKRGFHIHEIKDKMIADGVFDDEAWERFTEALYSKDLSKIKNIGIEVFASQHFVKENLLIVLKKIRRMQKRKPDDSQLIARELDCLMKIQEIELSLVKQLGAIGEIGQKNKKTSTAIHIHTSVPRPQAIADVPIDVTPEKR
jgi:hypothetical protein